MDVFDLRNRLVRDYRDYTRSFINIGDPRIRSFVDESLDRGAFWPEPLLQLNPAFESGGALEALTRDGTLHEGCARIFRTRKTASDPRGNPLLLHAHQRDAILKARQGKSYVLTSGTGSGKSLAYIVPIVDHVLKTGSGRGIQAIVVYPMNALANSQTEALREFLQIGASPSGPPATFARFTGQEKDDERERLRRNPPDILLTNYMMLELVLTRIEDRTLVRAARNLRFLVFDELHTYRGRQGADVAMLIRRCKEAFEARDLVCIGTSATMASGGTSDDQRAEVARVASTLFGEPFTADQIIQETLRRATPELDDRDPAVRKALRQAIESAAEPPASGDAFRSHPLASWIESTFGVRKEEATGLLVRQTPRPVRGDAHPGRNSAAAELAQLAGANQEACAAAIESFLRQGSAIRLEEGSRFNIFAFRLHQFFTRGDTVWATLESEAVRHLEIGKKLAAPGDRTKPLFPLAFCRDCGAAYYRIHLPQGRDRKQILPRETTANFDPPETAPGYLYISDEHPWPAGAGSEVAARVPEFMTDGTTVYKEERKKLPRLLHVAPTGELASEGAGTAAAFIESNFPFCLDPACRVAYTATQRSERSKLATLGVDNRSTATTILAVRTLLELLDDKGLAAEAKKLLSFTDNRQDASLQAGHFNDFVHVALIRSGLFKALEQAGPEGLAHDTIADAVLDAMDLPFADYAGDPDVVGPARIKTRDLLCEVLAYYLYRDLRRDWRVTAPNLEECGLLTFAYTGLDGDEGLLADEALWTGGIPDGGNRAAAIDVPDILRDAPAAVRKPICLALLDFLRRNLAIKANVLDPEQQRAFVDRTSSRLREDSPWHLADERELVQATIAYPRSRGREDHPGDSAQYLSSRGAFGAYLRRELRKAVGAAHSVTSAAIDDTIRFLLRTLARYGILDTIRTRGGPADPAYQINPDALVWLPGPGDQRFHDPTRVMRGDAARSAPNAYFVECYRKFVDINRTLEAREHTAQVSGEDREERESRFKSGELPLLFCSPTMELGVDIAELNLVNMRNVPPTPANYAQRSGRAGRQGQPALVFTYCAGQSPHDQYFFREPERMVAGTVSPPRIDLRNKDLLTSHIHAIWMQIATPDLGKTLAGVISLPGGERDLTLPLTDAVRDALRDPSHRARAAETAERVIGGLESELLSAPWYTEGWVRRVLEQIERSFDAACDRWRSLYRSAVRQRDIHHKIIDDRSRSAGERNQSTRLRQHAESQIGLLADAQRIRESDFYSYRYLATEGFLPGYNFPRLPISAYVPGRRGKAGRDEYVSRPRFLAISEFGPRSIVYHEGARYCVYKVNLDFGGDDPDSSNHLVTSTMKRCTSCAYAHLSADPANLDEICKRCGAGLGADSKIGSLVQLQNVSLKLRQRISCDEEERMRMGYEVLTAYSFPQIDGRLDRKDAEATGDGPVRARMSYGDAADLYRINRGWTRRVADGEHGFLLDIERGFWAANQNDADDTDDPEDATRGRRQARVVPYVRDSKNALVLRLEPPVDAPVLAGLEAALKLAIQQRFQLEPRELASDPVPSRDDRREILLYEAAEGGAGVLRQVVEDPAVLPDLARRALEILHYDPDTLNDRAAASCSRACYECLLDYGNQRDHGILDREPLRDLLAGLARGTCRPAGGPGLRARRLDELKARCDSDLERRFLDLLERLGLALPGHAQALVPGHPVRPDFLYEDTRVAVFIDGPHHDAPARARDDEAAGRALGESGYAVLRFHYKADWEGILRAHPDIFGSPRP